MRFQIFFLYIILYITQSSSTPSFRDDNIKWWPVMHNVPSTGFWNGACITTPSNFGIKISSANSIIVSCFGLNKYLFWMLYIFKKTGATQLFIFICHNEIRIISNRGEYMEHDYQFRREPYINENWNAKERMFEYF